MKNLYSIIVLIAIPFMALSQSVISNVVPNFGDQFVYNAVEDAPSPGPAGANVTWDFSNETISETIGNYTVMTPAQVDGSENFPGATMVWTVDMGFGILSSFMSFDNNAFTSYGGQFEGAGFSSVSTYTDPIVNFTYPLVYQNTGSDVYSGTSSGVSAEIEFSGDQSFVVDGYGTVITPYGTYSNVLRVTTTDTKTTNASGFEIVSNSTETNWYSPDYPAPVMSILHSEDYNDGTNIDSSKSMSALVSYTPASTTGLADRYNQNVFNIYPNPASDHITLTFDDVKANSVLNIYSSTGKLVETRSIQSHQKTDVTTLSPGLYIAVILVDGKQYAQKSFSVVR